MIHNYNFVFLRCRFYHNDDNVHVARKDMQGVGGGLVDLVGKRGREGASDG